MASSLWRALSSPWLSVNIYQFVQLALLLCLTFLLLKAVTLYYRWRNLDTILESFPGPPTHWLYGHVNQFHRDGRDLDKVISWVPKYPNGFPLWVGKFFATLVVTHPEYAKAVMGRSDPKTSTGYNFLVPWIGRGLLVLSGDTWFQHRRLLTPGFHYDVLKPYIKLISETTTVMLDKWDPLCNKSQLVELFQHVSLMTLDSIMKCAFSYSSNCQVDNDNAYTQAVYDLSFLTQQRIRTFPYHNDLIYYLSPQGYRFRNACRIAHQHTAPTNSIARSTENKTAIQDKVERCVDFCTGKVEGPALVKVYNLQDKVIQQRKKLLENKGELDKVRQKRHLDFLDILLCAKDENGQVLSDKDLRAEVDTFMFEGHDTTASGISWILYCMAKYPEHQQKCREEIRAVLGKRQSMEWEDINKIPYTTMCIKESLRLYPPVPSVSRELVKPITFYDGRSLPAGDQFHVNSEILSSNSNRNCTERLVWNQRQTGSNKCAMVSINIFCIHRNPSVWKDPELFDPFRFSAENSSTRHSHAFVPFAAGPRNCIGQNFAMNEMKVAVALTLNRFELSPDLSQPPLKLPQLVLRSKNGIHVFLKKAS